MAIVKGRLVADPVEYAIHNARGNNTAPLATHASAAAAYGDAERRAKRGEKVHVSKKVDGRWRLQATIG